MNSLNVIRLRAAAYTTKLHCTLLRDRFSTSVIVICPARNDVTVQEPVKIRCILAYSKGFVCSGGQGTLHLFEKTNDRQVYKKLRPVSISDDPTGGVNEQVGANAPPSNEIGSITLSPSEENIVCSTRSQQLYSLTLSAADLGKVLPHFRTASTIILMCVRMNVYAKYHTVFCAIHVRALHLISCHRHSIADASLGWMCAQGSPSLLPVPWIRVSECGTMRTSEATYLPQVKCKKSQTPIDTSILMNSLQLPWSLLEFLGHGHCFL